jgi:hypothetical protein
MTVQGSHKFYESKLYPIRITDDGGWACFTFAGDPELMKMFRDKFGEKVASPNYVPNSANIASAIEETLEESESVILNNQWGLYMLCGISIDDELLLLKTSNTTLRHVEFHDYIGVGDSSLLRQLVLILLRESGISMKLATAVAVYIVTKAKVFVDGCGGDTRLAQLQGGRLIIPSDSDILTLERNVQMAEFHLSTAISRLSDSLKDEGELEDCLQRLKNSLTELSR